MNLKEIESRLAQIKQDMNADDADIQALTEEADKLIEQRTALIQKNESRSALLAKIAGGAGETVGGAGFNIPDAVGAPGAEKETELEKRAKSFVSTNRMVLDTAESRSLLLSGGTIAKPTKVSGISDMLTGVSSIVDMVLVEDCNGMGSDIVAYEATESSASAATEGNAVTTSEGTFGTVTISPTLYSLVSYVSREIQNQTPLTYSSKVQAQAIRALRNKAATVITTAITSSSIKREVTDITAIDATTLRKIVLNHGSDETIEGNAVLFLNKTDLIAFGDVRGTNEKKAVYEITPDGANPNVGTIKDGGLTVRYCINSNCTALTGTTNDSTTATKPTLFYGNPLCAKLDLFGAYSVETSKDYKFAEGLLAVLGSMSIGSGVIVKNGFTVVSIAKAT